MSHNFCIIKRSTQNEAARCLGANGGTEGFAISISSELGSKYPQSFVPGDILEQKHYPLRSTASSIVHTGITTRNADLNETSRLRAPGIKIWQVRKPHVDEHWTAWPFSRRFRILHLRWNIILAANYYSVFPSCDSKFPSIKIPPKTFPEHARTQPHGLQNKRMLQFAI